MKYTEKTVWMLTLSLLFTLLLTGCGPLLGPASTPEADLTAAGGAVADPSPSMPGGSQPEPTPTAPLDIDEFMNRYNAMTWDEQFSYHSIGFLYFDALYTPEDFRENQEAYGKAEIAYVKAYMEGNGIDLPEDVLISSIAEGDPFYEQGKVTAKLYVTEFGEREMPDTINPIATLVELESDYLRDEDFPQRIARIILVPDIPGKRLDIKYLGDDQNGPPDKLVARFYIPHVPLEESDSACYILKIENDSFVKQAIGLEEWIGLSGY